MDTNPEGNVAIVASVHDEGVRIFEDRFVSIG